MTGNLLPWENNSFLINLDICIRFKQNVIFNLGKYIFLSNVLKCTRWKYACIPASFITASFHNQSVMVHLLNSFTISSYTVILKMSLHFPSFFPPTSLFTTTVDLLESWINPVLLLLLRSALKVTQIPSFFFWREVNRECKHLSALSINQGSQGLLLPPPTLIRIINGPFKCCVLLRVTLQQLYCRTVAWRYFLVVLL